MSACLVGSEMCIGASVGTVDRAVYGVRDLGYQGRVLIRCDGEPALKALRDAIVKGLPGGATPVVTPVGESQSNGRMEGAVRLVQCPVLSRLHISRSRRASPL